MSKDKPRDELAELKKELKEISRNEQIINLKNKIKAKKKDEEVRIKKIIAKAKPETVEAFAMRMPQ